MSPDRIARRPARVLVTCEHAGNRIPGELKRMFVGQRELLESHRGYDRGALQMARQIARALNAPLVSSSISRQVVDLNRSIGHPRLFGELTRALPPERRQTTLERHYHGYRTMVEACVGDAVSSGMHAIHISSHSFTPALDGEVRRADVGLLYDPARTGERRLCARWRAEMLAVMPGIRVRRNYPYRGTSDGLTAHLRGRFSDDDYAGIELEINQAFPAGPRAAWAMLRAAIVRSLIAAIAADGIRVD